MPTKQQATELYYEKEITALLHKSIAEIGKTVRPYIVYSSETYNILLSILANALIGTDLPKMATPISSFINGVFGIIIGTQLLSDNTSHRPNATRSKGLINLLNGIQMIGIHALGATALFPPSFAVVSAVGFILSLEETLQTCRRLDPEYWLKDSLAKMHKQAQLISTLEEELLLAEEQSQQPSYNYFFPNVIKEKQQQLDALQSAQQQIAKEATVQMQSLLLSGKTEKVQQLTAAYRAQDWLNIFDMTLINQVTSGNAQDKQRIHEAQAQIQDKNRKAAQDMMGNGMIWGLLFMGAVVLCVPGLQIPGSAILAIATLAYIAKNIPARKDPTQKIKAALADLKQDKTQENLPPAPKPTI